MMAFGLVEYGDSYGVKQERAIAALKWGTDWLLSARASENELYVQVGDGDKNHACWMRPEDLKMERPSFKIDSSKPGSEVAAEAAVALAAASIVFRERDSGYHDVLIYHATQLFHFADGYRGVYSNSVPAAASFYKSYVGYGNELLWAAAWLYRATSDPSYIAYMTGPNSEEGPLNWKETATEISWDDKRAATQLLAARLVLLDQQPLGTAFHQRD
jgi:endoglucanase